MKVYLLSLGAGLLVGILYGLLNIRSPAPPVVALVGLLGILIGEQIVPMARHILVGREITVTAETTSTRHTPRPPLHRKEKDPG